MKKIKTLLWADNLRDARIMAECVSVLSRRRYIGIVEPEPWSSGFCTLTYYRVYKVKRLT